MRLQYIEPLPNYEPYIGRWLWAFEETRRRTLLALEGLDSKQLDWLPAWGSNSIGTLLYHLAAIEADWLFTDILQKDEFPQVIEQLFPVAVRDESGNLFNISGDSLESHILRLRTMRECFLKSLQGMSIEEFRRVRSFTDYQVTPEWVIQHLMQHEAEHRGQIMTIREAWDVNID
jgi:uncharacterized damage-inducible protein DinB